MASNSGCTAVLVEGAMTANFRRNPSELVMRVSLPSRKHPFERASATIARSFASGYNLCGSKIAAAMPRSSIRIHFDPGGLNAQVAQRSFDRRHGSCVLAARRPGAGPAARHAGRRGQAAGRGPLRDVPPHQHDHRQLGLHARRLERADRHDDRHVGQPRHAGQADRIPRDAFPAEHPPRSHAGVRPGADHMEGMGEPAARAAVARSDGGARRIDLVGRTVRQRDRPAGSRRPAR